MIIVMLELNVEALFTWKYYIRKCLKISMNYDEVTHGMRPHRFDRIISKKYNRNLIDVYVGPLSSMFFVVWEWCLSK